MEGKIRPLEEKRRERRGVHHECNKHTTTRKTRQKKSNSSWVSSCHRVFLIRSDTGRPVASRRTAAKDGSAVTSSDTKGDEHFPCAKKNHTSSYPFLAPSFIGVQGGQASARLSLRLRPQKRSHNQWRAQGSRRAARDSARRHLTTAPNVPMRPPSHDRQSRRT